jgi:DUF971 family protein
VNPRDPWPLSITYLTAEKSLRVEYDDGSVFHLPAEYLRVESPSAEVQGHGSASKLLVAGKRSVSIRAMEPVGQYAVRITFDDGHDTGLFSWRYLHQLGREQDTRWLDYENRLRAAGLHRDA